jgi:hypothetical protein
MWQLWRSLLTATSEHSISLNAYHTIVNAAGRFPDRPEYVQRAVRRLLWAGQIIQRRRHNNTKSTTAATATAENNTTIVALPEQQSVTLTQRSWRCIFGSLARCNQFRDVFGLLSKLKKRTAESTIKLEETVFAAIIVNVTSINHVSIAVCACIRVRS